MTYESEESGTFSLALTGDWVLTRELTPFREESFLEIRDILRSADTCFANLEAAVHPYREDPLAQREGGGSYITTEPRLLEDMKWMGVDLLACGSSHADDYAHKGIVDTIRYLDQAGIAHAGSGRNLAEAMAPAFLDTPRGRVAMVAVTAQFRPHARAGAQRSDALGEPGVNGLRHSTEYVVDSDSLNLLRELGAKIGADAAMQRMRNRGAKPGDDDQSDRYDFLGTVFTTGEEYAVRTSAHPSDVAANLRQIAYGRYFADKVVVSLHCHDQGGPTLLHAQERAKVDELADFAVDFARQCIEAGADVVVCHGPQVPLGVELYLGKPIFHGIGAFVFQIETVAHLPSEAYERFGLDDSATPRDFIDARYAQDTRGHTADPQQWLQMFAVCDFRGDELKEIRIYPIDLHQSAPRSQRGRPLLADQPTSEQILARVTRLSRQYGVVVEERDGIGVIRP